MYYWLYMHYRMTITALTTKLQAIVLTRRSTIRFQYFRTLYTNTHMTDFDTQTTTLQITDTQSEPLAIEPTHMTEPTTTSFFTFDVATHTTLPRSHLTHITCDRMLYWT